MNLETIIDMQPWCKTWPPNGSSRIRAKQKLLSKHKRSLQKFMEPNGKPKVIFTANSLDFGKACEDLSWNHCTSTPHRSETNGIAERATHILKEDTSTGRFLGILRNIQDLLSDGKTPHERRFGQTFKQSFRLVHWLSITLFLRKTSQESIHLERKSFQDGSFVTLCTRGEFGRLT